MNLITLELAGRRYRLDPARAVNLAIPLHFDGAQPGFFSAPPASADTFRQNDFVGDTRQGGSCNVSRYTLIPHCNGTHTECIGHIVDDETAIADYIVQPFLPATLITVSPDATAGEPVISGESLESAWLPLLTAEFCTALIVRTLPNDDAKPSRGYEFDSPPAYFSTEAMQFVIEQQVQHLLVDLPSLDAMRDTELTTHRIFWGLPPGSRDCSQAVRANTTITELIYVPDRIADGHYLLNLQLPAFMSDAAPSRPLLYPLEKE